MKADPSTFDEICISQATGRGIVQWCREYDVRYTDVATWIDADPERAQAFEVACRARGATSVAQLESINRGTLAGQIDPRAAGVVSKSLQWLAGVYDRKRYGEQVRHDHRHSISADHLAELRALANGGSADGASVEARRGAVDEAQRVTRGGSDEAQRVTRDGVVASQRDANESPAVALMRATLSPPPIDAEFAVLPRPGAASAAPLHAQPIDGDPFDV